MGENTQSKPAISRRKLLASMGMAAVALGSGGMMQASQLQGEGTVTGYVYGNECPTDMPICSVTRFGAIGDGSTDCTAAIQKAIDCLSDKGGGMVFIPYGVYMLTGPLQMKSGVVLQGEGARTVLKASQTSGWNESYRAMVELVGTAGAEVRDLVLDQHGSGRNPLEHRISYTMLVNDAEDCTIENVLFRDAGYDSGYGRPSGPVLLLSAKDNGDTSTGTGGGVGGCRNIQIVRCSFVQKGTAGVGFCIRLHSDWLQMKPTFEHHLEQVVIDSCRFEGEFSWNVIELAGGATRYNKIVNCHFEGKTLTSIDFDKGTHHNVASNNTICGGGKPDMYVTDTTTRLACINVHGTGEDGQIYYTHSNSVVNNFISDCGNVAAKDSYEAAIGVEYAHNTIISGNVVHNINDGLVGGGIYIGKDVTSCSIHHNQIRGVRNGIFMNANGSATNDLKLIGNEVQALNYAANLTMKPGGGKGFLLLGNSFRTEGTTNPCVAGGVNSLREPLFAFNQFEGGATGLSLAYPNSLAIGNVIRDTQRSIRTYQRAVLVGNVSVDAQLEDLLVTSGEPQPMLLGNRFTNPANVLAPVVTYGAAIPNDGNRWSQRDIVYHTNPIPGGEIGWVCVAGGYASTAAWAPSTSYAAGAIAYAADRVYKCTVAGVSAISAPGHTSGIAANGTAKFQYIGTGLAAFKTFGSIQT
ncbi:glycosyl hydrolase family 28-related protein [Paenibacillus hodogayensis]|uniref:Glycosyl hydrolase family 28-related protein n=1 Tax=Paenibacillus hodogayensis TaxID=279208 RepID=A0ABV5VQV2_9BACL